MISVGIIGYGSFGSFLTRKLSGHVQLKVVDPSQDIPVKIKGSLEQVCKCDYVVLAVPISSYDSILTEIKSFLRADSVIVDISSVKMTPNLKLEELLPGCRKVVMHPLFGPQSAEESLSGHVVVMCPEVSDVGAYRAVKSITQNLGLKVIEKSAVEHDKEMALAQGLTFYLARALLRCGVHNIELQTPSFKKLLDLAELESHHSEDLFKTIQVGNPFTAEVRQKFIDVATELNSELT